MRILLLTSSFPREENDYSAKWILELSKELKKRNNKIIALAPYTSNLKTQELLDGIEVYRFKYAPEHLEVLGYGKFLPHEWSRSNFKLVFLYLRNILLFIPFLFFMFITTIKICKKEKIDILFSHWIFPCGLIGLLVAKILKIKPNLKIYGTDLVFMKKFELTWLGRWILNSYPTIVANSEYTKNVALSFGINDVKKIKVILEGVYPPKNVENEELYELRRKLGINAEKIIFSVHRLIPLKGTKYLIKAASSVVKEYPDVKFIIGGEGPMRTELESLIEELNLEDNVILTGFIPEEKLPLHYALCDIYVISSIRDEEGNTEGLGVPVIEAMSYGKPVIGFDVGGPKYTIRDGVNGFSVKEKDWGDMGKRILELLRDGKLRKEFGDRGRGIYYEEYTWDKVVAEYKKVIA
jgi:glycosyltransferase involved in cell wall biosynthesis